MRPNDNFRSMYPIWFTTINVEYKLQNFIDVDMCVFELKIKLELYNCGYVRFWNRMLS